MAYYPESVLERSMKIQEIIMRAMSGENSWIDEAEPIRYHTALRHPVTV